LINDKKLRGGVEIDSYGSPVTYWIQKNNPGDYRLNTSAPVRMTGSAFLRLPPGAEAT
jgi:capsid protein